MEAVVNMKRHLKEGGVLLLTMPQGKKSAEFVDAGGRLMNYMTLEEQCEGVEMAGLEVLQVESGIEVYNGVWTGVVCGRER